MNLPLRESAWRTRRYETWHERTSIIVMPYVQFQTTPHDLEKSLYNYRLQVFTCRKLGNKYVEIRCVRGARFNLVNAGFNVRTSRP